MNVQDKEKNKNVRWCAYSGDKLIKKMTVSTNGNVVYTATFCEKCNMAHVFYNDEEHTCKFAECWEAFSKKSADR